MPVEPLVTQAPEYDRPWTKTPQRPVLAADKVPALDPGKALKELMASPDLASRRWIWEQYDHLVRGHTVQRPGGDAAVVRIPGSTKALAITTDCTPRYCHADPETGGAQAVAESWRNLTAVGAKPLAITDNMNFGNPERPEIMGQFVGCIDGMRSACLNLDYPVVSGNVSLYNETQRPGDPADPGDRRRRPAARRLEKRRHRLQAGRRHDHPDRRDRGLARRLALCARAVQERPCRPAGLGAAARRSRLGEAQRRLGAGGDRGRDRQRLPRPVRRRTAGGAGRDGDGRQAWVRRRNAGRAPALHALLFGEDQARYILSAPDPKPVLASAHAVGVTATVLGKVATGGSLTLNGRVLYPSGSCAVPMKAGCRPIWLQSKVRINQCRCQPPRSSA